MTGRVEQAVVLAAGEGQRLRPFTALRPKVMIPIANKPILEYVVEAIARVGLQRIVMVVGYRKEQVLDYFGSGERFGVHIDYVVQEQQLGTAHALWQARNRLEGRFLVLSGDNIISHRTIAEFVTSGQNSILVKQQQDVSQYGLVKAKDGVVQEIIEKPGSLESSLVSTGIYYFEPEVFEFLGTETDLPQALQKMLTAGHAIFARETAGPWLDAVYPWDILRLNGVALSEAPCTVEGVVERNVILRGQVSVGKGTVLRSNSYIIGPAIIGENCEIGPNVCILPATSIGDNVIVSPFTEIKNSVIGSNVEMGMGSSIDSSIIGRGSLMGGHFAARSGEGEVKVNGQRHQVHMGAMLGEDCQIGDSVIVQPGVAVGNLCQVRTLKVIQENLPDKSLVV